MGNTEYYESTMRARDLVTAVRPAHELDEWASMSIEEGMQRDPNTARIDSDIAPYIANAEDRFFGSIVVLIYKGEPHFESLKDFKAPLPHAYATEAENIGFLTLDKGQLIVLDGQHRLLALEKVVKNEIVGSQSMEVPNDRISVIFIAHESNQKTRRIFNKVNRYAKSTSRGDNIITSEDDGYAIVTRRRLEDGAPLGCKGEEVVNWKNNTLSPRSTKLTTISAVYDIVKQILGASGVPKLDDQRRPIDAKIEEYYHTAERFLMTVLMGLKPYRTVLGNLSQIPEMREDDRPYSLLFKPAAQTALFKGLINATATGRLDLATAVERANSIDWRLTSDLWRGVIIKQNGSIDAGPEARDRVAALIGYLIAADVMTPEQVEAVRKIYRDARGEQADELPPPVVTCPHAMTA